MSPKLLGGDLARTPLGDLGFTQIDQVMALSDLNAERLGRDLLLQQRLI
jgi:diaminohydroxyphosphoribosylaminopyrimidine deaminase/5-amino-6-(5-phosphoribosylamino)uracil reductase